MKQLLLLPILFLTAFGYSQNKDCDCSAALSKDLKTKFENTEYRNFKSFLIEYFKSDEVTRKKMKNDKSFSFSSVSNAIIEALPIKNSTDINYKESSDEQLFNQIRTVYLKNQYLTDEQFNQVLSERMSSEQLEAYKQCLNNCSMANGVTYNIGGNQDDEFFIQLKFNSQIGGQSITLKENASFNNLEPINGLIFSKGLKIKDRTSITQFFKRVDPSKTASFSFNTIEPLNITPLTLEVNYFANSNTLPIGTIIASVLDYPKFLQANGFDQNSISDMSKVVWIPCDGRNLNASKYANYGIVPDLRGVFLRGINTYSDNYAGVANVEISRKNPEDKKAGEFQNDQIISHSHLAGQANVQLQPGNAWRQSTIVDGGLPDAIKAKTSDFGGSETRPKNVTVYYYIKIN